MWRTVYWSEDKGGVEWREVKQFGVEKELMQGYTLPPLLFNIYLMGIGEMLEGAQLECGSMTVWRIYAGTRYR